MWLLNQKLNRKINLLQILLIEFLSFDIDLMSVLTVIVIIYLHLYEKIISFKLSKSSSANPPHPPESGGLSEYAVQGVKKP